MESLQLPRFLMEKMDTSFEVDSSLISNAEQEFMLYDDNFADQFLNFPLTSEEVIETNVHHQNNADQLILELAQDIKNEPSWLDSVPFLEGIEPIVATSSPATSPTPSVLIDETSPKNTEELLFEFDAVCNAVGLSMTPPASPPTTKFLEGAPIYYIVQGEEIDAEILLDDNMESDESNDFIDELVRSHSNSIPDDNSSESSSSSPRSEMSSSPRSESSFDVSGYDDEWTPAVPAVLEVKRKKRPYGRPVEEKKVRKKEQNKNAATRYRQKKKQQLDEVLREEEALKAVHQQLKTQFDDTKREINYLKKLMREIMVAKGIQI